MSRPRSWRSLKKPLRTRLEIAKPAILRKLTPAEIRVACLVQQQHTSKEIADALGLSIRTVEVHRANIRRKLDLKGKSENLSSCLMLG